MKRPSVRSNPHSPPPPRTAFARICLGVMFVAASAAGQAQEVRRVTIGEYHRILITEALVAAAEASRGKQEFNQQIAAARQAFLSNRRDAAAEKKFADLLQSKDLYYFSQMLVEGTSEYSRKRVAGLNLVTGGALDGGIAPPAEPLFLAWVDKVRATLGARDRQELLALTDKPRVDAAIRQHEGDYQRYRAARDKHEIERADLAERVAKARAALTPEGKVKLHEQEVTHFDAGFDLQQGKGPVPQPLARLAADVRGVPVLRCRYGPNAIYDDGEPEYERFRFWQQTPERIDDLINANTNGHLGDLATRSAMPACPPTAVVARTAAVKVAAPGVRIEPGEYALEGVSVHGKSYRGRCSIEPEPEGRYSFRCKGRTGSAGKGTAAGNIVTVQYEQLGKMTYEVGNDGRLTGTWGGGSERLTRVGSTAEAARPSAAPRPEGSAAANTNAGAASERRVDRRCEMLRRRIEQSQDNTSSAAERRRGQLQAQYAQTCGG